VTLKGKKAVLVQISNSSDVNYELELDRPINGVTVPTNITLPARRTVLFEVKAGAEPAGGAQPLRYRVTNLLVGPEQPLVVTLPLKIRVAE
jgi:hypothetical protein